MLWPPGSISFRVDERYADPGAYAAGEGQSRGICEVREHIVVRHVDAPYPARAFWNSGSVHTSEAISEALRSMAVDISTTGTARRAAGTSTDRSSYSRTRLDRLRFGHHRRFGIRSADDAVGQNRIPGSSREPHPVQYLSFIRMRDGRRK